LRLELDSPNCSARTGAVCGNEPKEGVGTDVRSMPSCYDLGITVESDRVESSRFRDLEDVKHEDNNHA
jgi:hypothetical protein